MTKLTDSPLECNSISKPRYSMVSVKHQLNFLPYLILVCTRGVRVLLTFDNSTKPLWLPGVSARAIRSSMVPGAWGAKLSSVKPDSAKSSTIRPETRIHDSPSVILDVSENTTF